MIHETCNCPNGSYGKKHSEACYRAQVEELRTELGIARIKLMDTTAERDQLKSWQVVATQAIQAAECVIHKAHEYWDSDQDVKVGKLLIAMLSDDLKYSDDCTSFRAGVRQCQPQPKSGEQFRKHEYVVHTNCADPYCGICLGGLKLCSVCGQAEGELEPECPGKRSSQKLRGSDSE